MFFGIARLIWGIRLIGLIRLRGVFAVVGNIADIALLVLALMGIWRAAKGSAEPLPLIGKIKI